MAKSTKVEMKWYALATQTGREKRVKQELTKLARVYDLPIGKAVIARAPVKVVRNGKVKKGTFIEQRKAFPNYILVQMQFNPETESALDRLRKYGSVGLLPPKPPAPTRRDPISKRAVKKPFTKDYLLDLEEWRPVVVSDDEVRQALAADRKRQRGKKPIEVTAELGDQVTVVRGVYRRMEGEIQAIDVSDPTDPVVTVTVELMGRPVRVAVRWADVAVHGG